MPNKENLYDNLRKRAQKGNCINFVKYIEETYTGLSILSTFNPTSGDTLLLHSVRNGDLELLQWLHEHAHLQLERTNFEGKAAIHEAAQFGELECLRYLIRNGVSINPLKRADW